MSTTMRQGLLVAVVFLFVVAMQSILLISNEDIALDQNLPRPIRHQVESCVIEVPRRSLHDGKNITWMGDLFILPAGARMYSTREMKALFRHHSILFVGDSTMRRAYGTLYGILNSTGPHVSLDSVDAISNIDINKGDVWEVCEKWRNHSVIPGQSVCRTMPGTGGKKNLDWISGQCFNQISRVLQYDMNSEHSLTKNYSLIIVSGGLWDTSQHKRYECIGRRKKYPATVFIQQNEVLNAMKAVQSSSLAVVYRTAGFQQQDFQTETILSLNQNAMDTIQKARDKASGGNEPVNLSYIDWGAAIHPRSIGPERIVGNNDYHYGFKARFLFLQQLMNHLLLKHHEWSA